MQTAQWCKQRPEGSESTFVLINVNEAINRKVINPYKPVFAENAASWNFPREGDI